MRNCYICGKSGEEGLELKHTFSISTSVSNKGLYLKGDLWLSFNSNEAPSICKSCLAEALKSASREIRSMDDAEFRGI